MYTHKTFNKIESTLSIEPYNKKWPQAFKEEAKKLKTICADNYIDIHHIGSTSVPGLIAKPIIDIILVLKKNYASIKLLTNIGYESRGEINIPFRFFLKTSGTNPSFNLHIYEKNNPEIELNLLFRNSLRHSSKLCNDYSELKQKLVKEESMHKKNTTGFKQYTLAKDGFIKKVLKQAGFEGICLRVCTHHEEWKEYHRIRKKEIFDTITNLIYNPQHPTMSDPNHIHLVLYKGIQIIGIAQIELKTQEYCILRSIAIDKQEQSHGYGKYLLLLIEKWIKRKNIQTIYLHTDNTAVEFYQKLGYQKMSFADNGGVNIENKIDLGKLL